MTKVVAFYIALSLLSGLGRGDETIESRVGPDSHPQHSQTLRRQLKKDSGKPAVVEPLTKAQAGVDPSKNSADKDKKQTQPPKKPEKPDTDLQGKGQKVPQTETPKTQTPNTQVSKASVDPIGVSNLSPAPKFPAKTSKSFPQDSRDSMQVTVQNKIIDTLLATVLTIKWYFSIFDNHKNEILKFLNANSQVSIDEARYNHIADLVSQAKNYDTSHYEFRETTYVDYLEITLFGNSGTGGIFRDDFAVFYRDPESRLRYVSFSRENAPSIELNVSINPRSRHFRVEGIMKTEIPYYSILSNENMIYDKPDPQIAIYFGATILHYSHIEFGFGFQATNFPRNVLQLCERDDSTLDQEDLIGKRLCEAFDMGLKAHKILQLAQFVSSVHPKNPWTFRKEKVDEAMQEFKEFIEIQKKEKNSSEDEKEITKGIEILFDSRKNRNLMVI